MLRYMVENLTYRTTQSPTNDDTSSVTGCLVETAPIMLAWEAALCIGVKVGRGGCVYRL